MDKKQSFKEYGDNRQDNRPFTKLEMIDTLMYARVLLENVKYRWNSYGTPEYDSLLKIISDISILEDDCKEHLPPVVTE